MRSQMSSSPVTRTRLVPTLPVRDTAAQQLWDSRAGAVWGPHPAMESAFDNVEALWEGKGSGVGVSGSLPLQQHLANQGKVFDLFYFEKGSWKTPQPHPGQRRPPGSAWAQLRPDHPGSSPPTRPPSPPPARPLLQTSVNSAHLKFSLKRSLFG